MVAKTSTISGIFLQAELRLSYTYGAWFGLYTYTPLAGYTVVLDHSNTSGNLVIVDSGNVITVRSKVVSSQIAGISVGDIISCKMDFNTNYERCDNLTRGTFADGPIAANFVIRNEMATSDTTPPTVSITSPANGATIAGMTTISATASDNDGVSKSEFYVDNVLKLTDTSSPYSFSLDTTGLSNSAHTIRADAYDPSNNKASAQVSVQVSNTVEDTVLPTVSIKYPLNGAAVSGTTTISATASDNLAVSKVELYVDNILKSTDTSSPYTFSLDTRLYGNGAHKIMALAYDTSNNKASAQISVTVDNTAPSVSITSQTNGATVKGIIGVSVSAADRNSGIYVVLLYIDGIWQAADISSPYGFTLDTTKYADGSHKIVARAYDKALNYSTVEMTVNIMNE
jgi:hypothetical protein